MLLQPGVLKAEQVPVRHIEGTVHGFLVLRTQQGETLAAGDLIQIVRGDRLISELVFHFKDGSVDDEVTVFSQKGNFRLRRIGADVLQDGEQQSVGQIRRKLEVLGLNFVFSVFGGPYLDFAG